MTSLLAQGLSGRLCGEAGKQWPDSFTMGTSAMKTGMCIAQQMASGPASFVGRECPRHHQHTDGAALWIYTPTDTSTKCLYLCPRQLHAMPGPYWSCLIWLGMDSMAIKSPFNSISL